MVWHWWCLFKNGLPEKKNDKIFDPTIGKFFIMSTEFDKNISDWRHDYTDYKKKPKFSEILGTKVVQFWCYTRLVKKNHKMCL